MQSRGTATRGWRGARLAGIAAVLTSSVLVATGATAAPGGEKGKPESSPGQDKQAAAQPEPQAQPAPPAQSQPPPKAKGPKPTSSPEPAKAQGGGSSKAKTPKPAPTKSQGKATQPSAKSNGGSGGPTKTASGPKKSQNAGTGDNPQGRGPSGRTQYCHATHSESNPFVLITTNNNALWAHRRHQDEEDIIPATNGQCPGGTTPTLNPRPLDDGDPTPPGKTDDGNPGGPGDDGGPGAPGLNGVEGLDTPPGRVAPAEDGPADGDVLGANETSPAAGNGAGTAPAPLAEEPAADDGDSLPFTGLGLVAILAIALMALGTGITTRRVTNRDGR